MATSALATTLIPQQLGAKDEAHLLTVHSEGVDGECAAEHPFLARVVNYVKWFELNPTYPGLVESVVVHYSRTNKTSGADCNVHAALSAPLSGKSSDPECPHEKTVLDSSCMHLDVRHGLLYDVIDRDPSTFVPPPSHITLSTPEEAAFFLIKIAPWLYSSITDRFGEPCEDEEGPCPFEYESIARMASACTCHNDIPGLSVLQGGAMA